MSEPHGLDEMRRKNVEAGEFFFSPGAVEFFDRIFVETLGGPIAVPEFLVTGESLAEDSPRRFSVWRQEESGRMALVGKFMAYETPLSAYSAALSALRTARRNIRADRW